jgi:hypothetical protein
MTTMTGERITENEEAAPERIVADWVPVADWGEEARAIVDDIEDIQRVLTRMRGGPSLATAIEFRQAMEILESALTNRRLELADLILRLHRGEDVDPA